MNDTNQDRARAPNAPAGQTPPSALGDRVRSLRLPPPEPSRGAGSYFAWAVCGALVLMCLFLVYQAYFTSRGAADEESPTVAAKSNGTPSPGFKPPGPAAQAAEGEIALESKGYIIPAHQILVSPKVSGMIQHLSVEEGKRVTKGDILAELEKTDYESDRNRAQALLGKAKAAQERAQLRVQEADAGFRNQEKMQARADLEEAQSQLPQLQKEYERNVDLRKKDFVSQQDLEISESKFHAQQQRVKRMEAAFALMQEGEREERRAMAKSELAQAEADIRQAEAELIKAQWKLDNCTIRAPISGTILKKNAEEGNIVNPIAFNGSYSLCDMADLSDLEVELTIQERDISNVFPGQKVFVRSDAWPDRRYQGTVDRLMPIADRAKAAIPVRVKVKVPTAEEGVYLKPEMGVQVTFLKGPEKTPEPAKAKAVEAPPAKAAPAAAAVR